MPNFLDPNLTSQERASILWENAVSFTENLFSGLIEGNPSLPSELVEKFKVQGVTDITEYFDRTPTKDKDRFRVEALIASLWVISKTLNSQQIKESLDLLHSRFFLDCEKLHRGESDAMQNMLLARYKDYYQALEKLEKDGSWPKLYELQAAIYGNLFGLDEDKKEAMRKTFTILPIYLEIWISSCVTTLADLLDPPKATFMHCAWCNNAINSKNYISFASRCFCSDVCQLRFHKQELPTIGCGDAITDDDINAIENASGEERKRLRQKLFLKTSKAFEESDFIEKLRKGAEDKKDAKLVGSDDGVVSSSMETNSLKPRTDKPEKHVQFSGEEFLKISEVAQSFVEKGASDKPPRFIILMGGIGSGKTTLRRKNYGNGFVHFEPGDIYAAMKKVMGKDNPRISVYCAFASDLILKESLEEKKNIVIEIIGDTVLMIPIIEKIKEIGYKVHIQAVTADVAESYKRHLKAVEEDPDYLSAYFTQEATLSTLAHQLGLGESAKEI